MGGHWRGGRNERAHAHVLIIHLLCFQIYHLVKTVQWITGGDSRMTWNLSGGHRKLGSSTKFIFPWHEAGTAPQGPKSVEDARSLQSMLPIPAKDVNLLCRDPPASCLVTWQIYLGRKVFCLLEGPLYGLAE